ncbi:hypothetical protein [Phenylobacterium aquaticum]|uniref:hypothetical protein n=2 Tax=Phenylobacterium aquaticum TaxID=1763816 RepID=UPI0026F078F2|nr:hypothetical protein [Phenylobacterium aquaticum]
MSPALSVALLTVTYTFLLKVICFVIGYAVVRIGADLLREGVKGDFNFSANLTGAKADLVSASPGLLFLLLGIVLVGYAMWLPKPVTATEGQANPVVAASTVPDVPLPDAAPAPTPSPAKP